MPILIRRRAVSGKAPRHQGIEASGEAGSDESAVADEEDPGRHQGTEASRHQASGGFVVNALGLVSQTNG